MKKVRTLGTKRWVCVILVCALLLTTPSLALAASAPEQTAAAQPLTLESIPAELAQTLELDELSPLAELNDTDEEQLNSLTISNGDGTSTAYIFQGPIKYLDKETNSIQFIDNKLKASDKSSGFLEKYAYENTANDIKVYLPKKIKKGVDMEYENISINMRPEIIHNEKGVLKEYAFAGETMEVMEYPDAFGEGYHLQYQPINSGLKENILVEEYNGTNSFSFELKLKKGSAEISEDNRIIYIKDENGETVFILNQPYARDSYVGIDPELEHRTFDDYYILEQTGNKTYRVTMVIDSEFLAGEDTVYPVLIDPTAVLGSDGIQDMTAVTNGSTAYGENSETVVVGDNGVGSVRYITYSKTNFMWYYKFIKPENITSMYHRTRVNSLTSAGTLRVYDSNSTLYMSSSLSYDKINENKGSYISGTYISSQGLKDIDITALGKKWLKSELQETGGKNQLYGYIFDFSGPGLMMLSSAENATNKAYIVINYTNDSTLENGKYCIKNKFYDIYLQQGGPNVAFGSFTGSENQIWELSQPYTEGLYVIKSMNRNLYLGALNGQPMNAGDTPVVTAQAQEWRILKNPNGSYRLHHVNTAFAIEAEYDTEQTAEGIIAQHYLGYANQQWEFIPIADQLAVKLPNGTYIQRSKTIYDDNGNVDVEYKNESGVALEVNDSKQIIIEPIVITDITASEDNWYETVSTPFTYSVTGSDKISVSQSGNTLTVTGQALGEASITVTSGDAQTTIPVVVANKVLDVPHIRQEKSRWCWAACTQMMVEYYNPNTTATQTDMARTGQGLKENEEPVDKNGGYDEMKTIVETYTSETTVQKQETEFTESMLLSELNSGDPVIYLSTREKDGEWEGGHFNIIYGYYWDSSNNRNIYLTYDPWDTCARANSIHLDVWRRSWANIQHEMDTPATTDRAPDDDYNTDAYYYYANWFMYCQ